MFEIVSGDAGCQYDWRGKNEWFDGGDLKSNIREIRRTFEGRSYIYIKESIKAVIMNILI